MDFKERKRDIEMECLRVEVDKITMQHLVFSKLYTRHCNRPFDCSGP